MSKEFDDINNKSKDQDKILKEINAVKKEVKDISFKVDMMLEILNNFTIMLAEEEDEYADEDDDSDESWIPEQQEDWNSYEDDEDI